MHQLLSLKAHMEMLVEPVRDQLFLLHNHLLEEKNNGWIMHRILEIGVRTRWLLLTQESHMPQLHNLKAHMEMLVEPVRDQPFHLHNHL